MIPNNFYDYNIFGISINISEQSFPVWVLKISPHIFRVRLLWLKLMKNYFKVCKSRSELCSYQICSKMLRQFSKGSLISISPESSKTHIFIKVLYKSIWLNLCRFLVTYSECPLVLFPVVQLYNVLGLRSLEMKYFSFANVSIPV